MNGWQIVLLGEVNTFGLLTALAAAASVMFLDRPIFRPLFWLFAGITATLAAILVLTFL